MDAQNYEFNFEDIIIETFNEIKRIEIKFNRDEKLIKVEFECAHKKEKKPLNSQQNINL